MAKKHTGTAGPLGLFAFGFTACLFMLDMLYPGRATGYMAPLAYVFGGVVQIIAAVIEIYREDVFMGCVFGSYGSMWVAIANGCGSVVFFCAFGLLTFGFWIITLRKNIMTVIMFTCLTTAFFLLGTGVGLNPPSEDIAHAGQWTAFVTGCIAIYIGFGIIIHETYKLLLPGLAPMPQWFPLCCVYRRPAGGKPKVSSVWGLRFTPSERAYYAGSVASSLPLTSSPTAAASVTGQV